MTIPTVMTLLEGLPFLRRRWEIQAEILERDAMKPDEVCERYAKMHAQLKLWVEEETVFIEGDSAALEFLGELFLSQANFQEDSGFQISPAGAGRKLFSKGSTHGIYIHRLTKA